MEVAGLILGVLPLIISTYETSEYLSRSSKELIGLKNLERDLQVGLGKFKIWNERWLGQKDQRDSSSKALWGAEGWENVQRMLERILQISLQIESASKDIKILADSHPHSRWKLALLRLKKRPKPSITELKKLVEDFNQAVDAIWLYSDAAFDALHGVLTPGQGDPIRDLLESALQSRSGSLQLYKLCCNESTDCSLELNLRPKSDLKLGLHEYGGSSHLYYRLFARTPKSPKLLRKLEVEYLPGTSSVHAKPFDFPDHKDSGFQLFKIRPSDESTIIPVERKGTDSSFSSLRIQKQSLEHVKLNSEPISLTSVFETLKGKKVLHYKEHFSVGAKIELAYKIVESSFFLLGTPWLSMLNSQNLLRLQDTEQKRPNFVLKIQAIGLVDMLFDDSEALSETKQLFSIGVLLMEIALGTKVTSLTTNLSMELPLVEQAMGAQYCKATAFCLQHRQPKERFYGLGKYEDLYSEDWEKYLSELLRDFYSQVILRLEELQEIDTESLYRSRKSWLLEDP